MGNKKVRLVSIQFVATWIEDDGENVKIVTGEKPAILDAADFDNLGPMLREQAKAHEVELNKGQPNRAARRSNGAKKTARA
jgi:hypothetical protein